MRIDGYILKAMAYGFTGAQWYKQLRNTDFRAQITQEYQKMTRLVRRGTQQLEPITSLFDDFMKEMDLWMRPFRDTMGIIPLTNGSTYPKVNVYEKDQILYYDLAVPYFDKDDLKVEVDDTKRILKVSGKALKQKESDEPEGRSTYKFYYRELSKKAFCRTFRVPRGAEINTPRVNLDRGLLSVSFPLGPTAEETTEPFKEVCIS